MPSSFIEIYKTYPMDPDQRRWSFCFVKSLCTLDESNVNQRTSAEVQPWLPTVPFESSTVHNSAQNCRWSTCQDRSNDLVRRWEWCNLGCFRNSRWCSRVTPTSLGCRQNYATNCSARWLMRNSAKNKRTKMKISLKLTRSLQVTYTNPRIDLIDRPTAAVNHSTSCAV